MLDGTEGKEANGTSPAIGATTVNGTSPLSSAIHRSLIHDGALTHGGDLGHRVNVALDDDCAGEPVPALMCGRRVEMGVVPIQASRVCLINGVSGVFG
ncbi:hypothetical protein A3649_15855 [Mycobacterium ulcerans]|nr:hypothetical protein A3649_15855 [Mycobacterium ulcerans]